MGDSGFGGGYGLQMYSGRSSGTHSLLSRTERDLGNPTLSLAPSFLCNYCGGYLLDTNSCESESIRRKVSNPNNVQGPF